MQMVGMTFELLAACFCQGFALCRIAIKMYKCATQGLPDSSKTVGIIKICVLFYFSWYADDADSQKEGLSQVGNNL